MKIKFSKMQGAGNDFIVLDETVRRYDLTQQQYQRLADRRFGIGADQILSIRPAPNDGVDFSYIIHNADGREVEHCGNGARCFARYVHEKGLSQKSSIRVQTMNRQLQLSLMSDGRVGVDMGMADFSPASSYFDNNGIKTIAFEEIKHYFRNQFNRFYQHNGLNPSMFLLNIDQKYNDLNDINKIEVSSNLSELAIGVVSMGNPHAVTLVPDVNAYDVQNIGKRVTEHLHFQHQVNASFMQIIDRQNVILRVHERGAGETLACGSGACAAAVFGMALGLLDFGVEVQMRGGKLRIEWKDEKGSFHAPSQLTVQDKKTDSSLDDVSSLRNVRLIGPAECVFEGEIEI